MPRIDNEKFYTSAIKKYGVNARGVNWNSTDNQLIRFDKILKMLPDDLEMFTLTDAGCGFGDLYIYMLENKRVPKEYIGIDSLYEMCSIASQKTEQKIVFADICKDELPITDYYVCSGAMNILDEFETHLFIRNCFTTCREGFIFNILHSDKKSENYNYMTGEEIIKIAKELNVESVVLKDGYLKSDITVGFFKKAKESL